MKNTHGLPRPGKTPLGPPPPSRQPLSEASTPEEWAMEREMLESEIRKDQQTIKYLHESYGERISRLKIAIWMLVVIVGAIGYAIGKFPWG